MKYKRTNTGKWINRLVNEPNRSPFASDYLEQYPIQEGTTTWKIFKKWAKCNGYHISYKAFCTLSRAISLAHSYNGEGLVLKERTTANCPDLVVEMIADEFKDATQEMLLTVAMDCHNAIKDTWMHPTPYHEFQEQVKAVEMTHKGTVDECPVHTRDIFRFAIQNNAKSICLVHNHPSGDPEPSKEDVRLTEQVIEAGKLLGLTILDHIIIGNGRYESLRERGYM